MPDSSRDRKTIFTLAFFALLCLQLLPVWWFPYFPSADGPSHLFNSYVFVNYAHTPVFEQAFTPHIPPAGNLAGHGLVIALMHLSVPPETCEKIIVTLCIVGLALAFLYAATAVKSLHPAAPLLIFPFLYNWPEQMGFWSFSLGVPFILVCVGLCLRHHGHWNVRNLSWLFLSVAAVYACHPLSWAACGLIVGLMSIAAEFRTRNWRQALPPILVFIPFAIPNLIFAHENSLVIFNRISSLRSWLWPLYTSSPVRLFAADFRPARLLFLFLVLASLGNLVMRRKTRPLYADILLPISIILFLLGLFSPGRIGEGTFIEVRLLLFGFLILVLWLAITLPRPLVQAASAIAVLLAFWLAAARLPAWKQANAELAAVNRLGSDIAPNSFVCQIDYRAQSEDVQPLDHAVDLWAPRHIVDLLDYEAGRKAFWTRFRPGYYLDESYLNPASHGDFEAALKRFQQATGKTLDYILITNSKSPQTALQRLLPTLSPEYKLLETGPPGVAVFKRQPFPA